MEDKRHFTRVACNENVLVGFEGRTASARLLNISIKGALVELEETINFQPGDTWKITLPLGSSSIILHFGSEVVHQNKNMAGVKFVHIDLGTMIHLRSLIEARTLNPKHIEKDFASLT